MEYRIEALDAFDVDGQTIALTGSAKKNTALAQAFWRTFNAALKKAYRTQGGNWVKYAFMSRKDGVLYYTCAVPAHAAVPEGFLRQRIPRHRCLVFEYRGRMEDIYGAYREIYHTALPQSGFAPAAEDFLHFEKYTARFRWNAGGSVIEIWVPVREKSPEDG
ncbi:MAG: effector binding domain-containing protein [Oscillospiraceae bacterium]|nr:effector binding domain-containing protein [Oscillospiraceae bacterium]